MNTDLLLDNKKNENVWNISSLVEYLPNVD